MIKAKGSGFSFLRELMKKQGADFENTFMQKLNEEELKIYRLALPISWIELGVMANIYQMAAQMLFPKETIPMVEFGRQQAFHALGGIYSLVLRFVNPDAALEKTAKVWNLYYDRGDVSSERTDKNKNEIVLTIKNFPEFSLLQQQLTLGYSLGVLEKTGCKNVRGRIENSNPNSIKIIDAWD